MDALQAADAINNEFVTIDVFQEPIEVLTWGSFVRVDPDLCWLVKGLDLALCPVNTCPILLFLVAIEITGRYREIVHLASADCSCSQTRCGTWESANQSIRRPAVLAPKANRSNGTCR